MPIVMYDAIFVADLEPPPPGAQAYAGYVDGSWADYVPIKAAYPNVPVLPITVIPGSARAQQARCIDIENGAYTNAQVHAWFTQKLASKPSLPPVLYTRGGNVDALHATMTANGFARSSYLIWSAHYAGYEHICGPSTCGLTKTACDGTQWANGAKYDTSILNDSFFGTPPAPAPAVQITKDPDMLKATRPDGGSDIYVLRPNGTAVHVQKDSAGKTLRVEDPPGTWEALVDAGWRDNSGTQQAYLEGIGTDGADYEDTWQAPETGWQGPVRQG